MSTGGAALTGTFGFGDGVGSITFPLCRDDGKVRPYGCGSASFFWTIFGTARTAIMRSRRLDFRVPIRQESGAYFLGNGTRVAVRCAFVTCRKKAKAPMTSSSSIYDS